jgi:hypothetical protein
MTTIVVTTTTIIVLIPKKNSISRIWITLTITNTIIAIVTTIVITITTSPKKHHFHNNHYQHHHSHRQAIDASPWPSALELLKTAGWLQNLRGLSRAAQLLPGWRSSVALLGALVEDGRGCYTVGMEKAHLPLFCSFFLHSVCHFASKPSSNSNNLQYTSL